MQCVIYSLARKDQESFVRSFPMVMNLMQVDIAPPSWQDNAVSDVSLLLEAAVKGACNCMAVAPAAVQGSVSMPRIWSEAQVGTCALTPKHS